MTYRKFKADYLFTGREMAEKGAVLVTTEDGTVQDILPSAEAGQDAEYLRGALSPGFINCHCHLELSHLKGAIPEKTGMVDFLLAVMQNRNSVGSRAGASSVEPAGLFRTPEFIQIAIASAEESMWRSGIVAVGDICNTTHSLAQKMGNRLYYHNFIETMGFMEQTAAGRLKQSRTIFDAFSISPHSLVPHAPYSVSPRLFGLIADLPDNHLLTIHNQESEAENEFYRSGQGDFLRLYQAMGLDTSFWQGTGKRSLESYLPFFCRQKAEERSQTLLLVHNVATNEEDLQFAMNGSLVNGQRSPDLFFCLCPNANLYIGGKLPDVKLLVRHNCSIVIGTDSLASNHQLSILEELKTLQLLLPELTTTTLLKWATSNGAQALQVGDRLGSFVPGKRPGLVLIENLEEGRFTASTASRRIL